MNVLQLNAKVFYFLGIVVLMFFFVFGMPTPVGSIAQLLTVLIVVWSLFNCKKYYFYIPKEILYLFIFLLFDFLMCLLIPCILGTYDFSIVSTKLNFIASILATYVVASFFSSSNMVTDEVFFKFLLSIFLIQAIIIVLMLLDSDLAQLITSYTRSSDQGTRVIESYNGARGLGVADSSVFGLAIVMGVFIFISFFSYKKKYIGFKYFVFLLLIGGMASVSAGRTAILGMIFGLIYLMLNFKNIRSFVTLTILFLVSLVVGYILINIDRDSIRNETLGSFYAYSMEPIINYMRTGTLSTGSTDVLQRMYFPLTEKQYLIGDGRYMEGEKYYMSTDVGYMRFALFYGGFLSLCLYFYFIYFVSKIAILSKKYCTFLIFLLIFSFTIHYKGEVILFAISYNKILFLILFFVYMRYIEQKRGLYSDRSDYTNI